MSKGTWTGTKQLTGKAWIEIFTNDDDDDKFLVDLKEEEIKEVFKAETNYEIQNDQIIYNDVHEEVFEIINAVTEKVQIEDILVDI